MVLLGCDVCGLVDRYQRFGGLLHPYFAMKIEVGRFSIVLITGSRVQFPNAGSYYLYRCTVHFVKSFN